MLKHLIAIVATLTIVSIASVAQAAPHGKAITGTWSGDVTQVISIVDPGTDEVVESEWSKRMTISVLNGRVVRIYTWLRSVCPGPGVRDHRVSKYWGVKQVGFRKAVGRGPQVSPGGAFTVRLQGSNATRVEIAGGLFASSGTGRLTVRAAGDCAGEGTWKLERTQR
jgi:hypothetical protein